MNYQDYLNESNPVVTIYMKNLGTIIVELFPLVAPNTVSNFVDLVSKGYYNGLTFHRIIPGFMIQGGWGQSPSCPISGEFNSNGFNNPLKHTRGVISMARTSDPNSQTTQFFIMHQNAPHLDGAYAAFGVVIEGIEVVDKIALKPRNANDQPNESIQIESMVVDLKSKSYPKPICYR
jgi:peptidyl-prolyl cis-trans isomerase B (cyclophilin B)